MRLQDIGRSREVLLNQWTGQGGIRGRSDSQDAERELGWFDNPWTADISRDGSKLLFSEVGTFGGNLYAVCLRGMDGSPPVRLGEGFACSLSPDGRWALAIHFGPPHRLLRLPTGAGDSTALPRGPIDRYYGASWLPDGKSVVFSGSEAGRGRRSYIQDLSGGLPRAISAEGIAGWKLSPDGRFVAALSADQRLFVCPTSGDSGRFVSQLAPYEQILQWATDGRSLYVEVGGIDLRVSRIDLATGIKTPWRTYRLPDPAGASFLNSVLTPDTRSYAYTYGKRFSVLYLVEGLK
jgi:WD40 repeat protein